MHKSIIRKIISKLKFDLNQNDPLMPKIRRDDDIFLVSYPKSGNTWVSFILANIIVEKLNLDMEVNHFNIRGFIPDIQMGREIPMEPGYFPFKRMIKSHAMFHPKYRNVIYILRDPRSVMVSYYKYLLGLGQFKGDIGDLIRDKNYGIKTWTNHLESWLDGIVPATCFNIFKYEDFKLNPEHSVRNLAKLIGVNLSDEEFQRALFKSSFENMQKVEEDTGSFALKKHDPDFKFIRKGEIAEWKNILNDVDLHYIRDKASYLMSRFGYTD